jgi:hypothetical protein
MLSLNFAFWMFIIFFSMSGAMRGWAKELLVTFSVVLAIFIVTIVERFVPIVTNFTADLSAPGKPVDFWVRSALIILFTFFGYQTPRFPRLSNGKLAREKVQDTVLGILVGGVNGYMVVGSLWFYLHQIGYRINDSLAQYIFAPNPATEIGIKALEMVAVLPPALLVAPWIYFVIALAFAFVVIVFV